jgi:hypothetical protein
MTCDIASNSANLHTASPIQAGSNLTKLQIRRHTWYAQREICADPAGFEKL